MTRKLKTGFTTGTAAAAAAKGALLSLVFGQPPNEVSVLLLTGDTVRIPIHDCRIEDARTASCSVIKDAGDDPDITHGAEIGARITLLEGAGPDRIRIVGGEGVGRVTKPGLEVPPGNPAINPGPRKMITRAVDTVLRHLERSAAVRVEIFVPDGRKLSERTLNARLGIVNGISILGTTGLVKPLSHDAYVATIRSALSVARAQGHDRIVLSTGRRSERFAQAEFSDLPEECFVQIGDFFKQSLEMASLKGFKWLCIAVFFGKALKMAQAIPHTHAGKSALTLRELGDWARRITKDAVLGNRIEDSNTAREAFYLLIDRHPEVIADVGKRIVSAAYEFIQTRTRVQSVVFDYDGAVVFDSEQARG